MISMGFGNFRKLSLLPEVKQNLLCTLSVDFGFREFRSFQSNSMAKGNLTNIAVTYNQWGQVPRLHGQHAQQLLSRTDG
jgi:hypothetical protein